MRSALHHALLHSADHRQEFLTANQLDGLALRKGRCIRRLGAAAYDLYRVGSVSMPPLAPPSPVSSTE